MSPKIYQAIKRIVIDQRGWDYRRSESGRIDFDMVADWVIKDLQNRGEKEFKKFMEKLESIKS